MAILYLKLLLIATYACSVMALYHRCPPNEDLNPCTCDRNEIREVKIVCVGSTDRDLEQPLANLKEYAIDVFLISHSFNLSVRPNFFQGLHIHAIKFVHSDLLNFSLFKAFNSLQNYLYSIQVVNCTIHKCDLEEGNGYYRMLSLIFRQTDIFMCLPTKFTSLLPSSLKIITLSSSMGSGMVDIESKAFARFSTLSELDLSHNSLSSLERRVFPKPARRLHTLNLGFNKLTSLPEDLFTEMPRLEFLNLSLNSIKFLSVATFRPIWNQLTEVSLSGVSLECDCDAVWMLKLRQPSFFDPPTCSSHKSYPITQLKIADLCKY